MSRKTSLKKNGPIEIQRWGTAIACLLIAMSTTGCSMLSSSLTDTTPVPVAQSESSGAYLVNMSGGFAKASEFKGQIDGPLTVQNALERSGAIKRFRSMDIMVHRIVKETGRVLKMPVNYSPRKNAVLPETDYALHPGDRIVVSASSNSALDKLVETLDRSR